MIEQIGKELVFRFDGETLVITPWGENGVRVRSVMMGEIEQTDYALEKEPPLSNSLSYLQIEQNGAWIIQGKIKAVMELNDQGRKCRLLFYDRKGNLLLEEIRDGGALKLKARAFKPIPGGHMGLKVSFEGKDGEMLFGMGQYQQERMNWKGCMLELAQRNSQASVPFLISSRGYGFLWHNPAIGQVIFGENVTCWEASCTRQMDYWVTAGDTPAEILSDYVEVTGKPPVMPEYGLGFWQSRLRYWNQEQILEIARKYNELGIPLDVIVCDYFHWPKLGDFRFDQVFFPNPEEMVRELRQMGTELMVSVWPEVALDSENWRLMQERGLLVRPERGVNILKTFGGDSSCFDATNPEARKTVWELCRKNYYQIGIRNFWLDDAEPNYQVLDFDHYRLYLGTNEEVGNLYPKEYARTFYEGLKEEKENEVISLVRCAWAGSQKYGALIWSGDVGSTFQEMRRQLCAGLSMGLSGIAWWTTDIGGFSSQNLEDESFKELLVRWFQWGTFCPVMRLHGDRKPEMPVYRPDGSKAMRTGGENEIWSFGPELFELMKTYIQIRKALRPYLHQVMMQAHFWGWPMMRAMLFAFPDDPICWNLKEQYMLGDSLLVAPVLYAGAKSISVYLPPTEEWIDFWEKKPEQGGWRTVKVTLDKIPVWIRRKDFQKFNGNGGVNNVIPQNDKKPDGI